MGAVGDIRAAGNGGADGVGGFSGERLLNNFILPSFLG